MGSIIDIKYRRPSLVDCILVLFGALGMFLGGCFVLWFAWGLMFLTPEGGGLARYAGGIFFACFGLVGTLIGPFGLYSLIRISLDRSPKLSLSDEALTVRFGTPPFVVPWRDVREVNLRVVSMHLVRQSATIILLLTDREEVKVEVAGLEMDVEVICHMIERRISQAEAADPSVHCHGCNGTRVRWVTLARGAGMFRTNCSACQGTGLLPNPKYEAAEAGKQRCQECGGLSPDTVKSCYHCAAPLGCS